MWNEDLVREIAARSKTERWAYPKTFEALKEAGVTNYRTMVANHEITYFGNGGQYIESPQEETNHLQIAPQFNEDRVIAALEHHQRNRTPYEEFLRDIARAGVKYYEVDMENRRINYTSGRDGECHVEDIPPFNR